jgi:hypothetical protein
MKQNSSMQIDLWSFTGKSTGDGKKQPYSSVLTVSQNQKGILDVDTVKGCEMGMKSHPQGGCYGECYAQRIANRFNFDFGKSVSRKFLDREHAGTIIRLMNYYRTSWYRIGTSGDPSHDWHNTLVVCRALRHTEKIPVIVTKHWKTLSDSQISELRKFGAVINTSTSGMDTDSEIKHRTEQLERIREFGVKSICRVVTCNYGFSEWGRACAEKQEYLMSKTPIIDNPFRVGKFNTRVVNGDIIVTKRNYCIGGKYVSLHSPTTHLGSCDGCSEQCGFETNSNRKNTSDQLRIGV